MLRQLCLLTASLIIAPVLSAADLHGENLEIKSKKELQSPYDYAANFEKGIKDSFGCPQVQENLWKIIKALITDPRKSESYNQVTRELNNILFEYFHGTTQLSFSENGVNGAKDSAMKLFQMASIDADALFAKSHFSTRAAFAEAINNSSLSLNSNERDFRNALHEAISVLSNYSIASQRLDCETKHTSNILMSFGESKRAETQSQPKKEKSFLEGIIVKLDFSPLGANVAPVNLIKENEDSHGIISKEKETETEEKPKEKAKDEVVEVKSPSKAISKLETFEQIDDLDILDPELVYQDAACRKNINRNVRRMTFLFFDRYVRQTLAAGEKVEMGMIRLFASRAAYMTKESSKGYTTRVYSHTKNSVTGEYHSTPDFSGDISTKILARKLLEDAGQSTHPSNVSKKARDIAAFAKVNPVAWTKEGLSRFRGILHKDEKVWTDKEGRDFIIDEPHGTVSSLALYKRALESESLYGVEWNFETDFGINQQSTNRLYLPASKDLKEKYKLENAPSSQDVLTGDLSKGEKGHVQWLSALVKKDNFKPFFAYCRSHDFFIDPLDALIAQAKDLVATCPVEKLAPKKISELEEAGITMGRNEYKTDGLYAVSKTNVTCFAKWMMLCPGLNYNTSLFAPDAYFNYSNTRKPVELMEKNNGGPLCESSFKDILDRYTPTKD